MRHRITLVALAIVSISPAQVVPSLFSPGEREKVLRFWAEPGRYKAVPPADAKEKGLWQVRLTPAASQWLWNYNKGKKILPSMVPPPLSDEQKDWEKWILAKLAHDRWAAGQIARQANESLLGVEPRSFDRTLPKAEPPLPGPMPDALYASVGNPPPFAEAVVPMDHTVTFDDWSVTYQDNVGLNPRYAYYRFPHGVRSTGLSVKTLPKDRLERLFQMARVADGEARVMRSVSVLEGGFDSINTYDTGYVSVGFIQFASLKDGAGSLGGVLLSYKNDDPLDFTANFRRFGVDVTPTGALAVLDPSTGAEVVGAAANERIIEDKRLIAVFQRAALKSEVFCAEQIKSAKGQYFPAEDPITLDVDGRQMTGKICDFIRSEAGMATLMDRKVNTGKCDPLLAVATRIARERGCTCLADLAPYEREIVAALRYRKDYLSDPTLSQPSAMSAASRPYNTADRGSTGRGHRKVKRKAPKA